MASSLTDNMFCFPMSITPTIASNILQYASDGRKKLTHQIAHGTGNCSPCSRTQALIGFL